MDFEVPARVQLGPPVLRRTRQIFGAINSPAGGGVSSLYLAFKPMRRSYESSNYSPIGFRVRIGGRFVGRDRIERAKELSVPIVCRLPRLSDVDRRDQ